MTAAEVLKNWLAKTPELEVWTPERDRTEEELLAILGSGMDEEGTYFLAAIPSDVPCHAAPDHAYGIFCNAHILSRGLYLWAFTTEDARQAFLADFPDAKPC